MKKSITCLLFVMFVHSIYSQTLQNDVISSGGGHSVAGTIDMEFNIGEVVTETSETTGLTITQGFLQPSLSLTSIEADEGLTGISVYPNPVSDELTVEIPLDFSTSLRLVLTDLNGKLLISEKMLPGSNVIQMKDYPNGTYIITIDDPFTNKNIQVKIVKIR